MSKNADAAVNIPTAPIEPQSFDIPLDEFCIRLSMHDRRVEMIGAFHFTEKQVHPVDSEANYQRRYAAFCVKPVL